MSYILVATVASLATLWFLEPRLVREQGTKLGELEKIIDTYFIEDVDSEKLQDAAASAMVSATGDRWSYYIPASQYASYVESGENAYVGVGITVQLREDQKGLDIISVEENGPAAEAGVQQGDILVAVNGENVSADSLAETKNLIRGEENTQVELGILRNDQRLNFSVTRKRFETPVATYEMLDDGYGLIRIKNFESKCADETIAAVNALVEAGAKGLIFDVRFNPGGYKSELVEVLDYLLPEGPLFRSEDYRGKTSVDESDKNCVEIPMVVLVNGDSYSAAEFFAAALQEYEWATVVGQQTCGKGYFQSTFNLSDGSAVAVSIGKYFTPEGKSLAGVGITPDVTVEVDEETYAAIYYGNLTAQEDSQLQAAISALKSQQ